MRQHMSIGEAARAAGLTPRQVRHYEAVGLLAAPGRTPAGYRTYDGGDLDTLRYIREARGLGFPLSRIATLVAARHASGGDALAMVRQQLADVERQQRALADVRQRLAEMLAGWPAGAGISG